MESAYRMGQRLEDLEMDGEHGECGATYKKMGNKEKKLDIMTVQEMRKTSAKSSTSPRVTGESTRREKRISARTTRGSLMLRTECRFVALRQEDDVGRGIGVIESINGIQCREKDTTAKTETTYSNREASNV